MLPKKFHSTFLLLTIPQVVLMWISAYSGVSTVDFYAAESLNWQIQSAGQDQIDFFVLAPVILISAFLAAFGKTWATYVWAGANLYSFYTFVIFCFSVHFNQWFLVYCFILGLSFYSLVLFVKEISFSHQKFHPSLGYKLIGVYFILLSVLFYYIWLADVIPFIVEGKTPDILLETGLFTNPVHVLDLSIILPGMFITGLLLLTNNGWGYVLAPVWLCFFVIMDITIAYLAWYMQRVGLSSGMEVVYVMSALACISAVLFIISVKSKKTDHVAAG